MTKDQSLKVAAITRPLEHIKTETVPSSARHSATKSENGEISLNIDQKSKFSEHLSPSLAGLTTMYLTGSSSDFASSLIFPSQKRFLQWLLK